MVTCLHMSRIWGDLSAKFTPQQGQQTYQLSDGNCSVQKTWKERCCSIAAMLLQHCNSCSIATPHYASKLHCHAWQVIRDSFARPSSLTKMAGSWTKVCTSLCTVSLYLPLVLSLSWPNVDAKQVVPPSWIFILCEFGHSGVLIVCYLCFVPNLVQTSVIVTEIDAHSHICFRLSFDDVTRINFRFWLLIVWSSSHGRDASSHIISCKISLSSPKLLIFFRNSRWRPPPSWIFSLCEVGHSGVLVVWYLCSVPNLV